MSSRRIFATALRAGIPFGLAMGVYFTIVNGLPGGPIAGLVSGVLFGIILGVFQDRQARRMMVASDRYEGERLLHQGPANHWRNGEARGGWLVLTGARLVFRSHGKNFQNAPAELPLATVRAVEPCRSLGIIPNGLRILRTDGGEDRFVVADRATWIAKLAAARPTAAAVPAR